MGFVFAVVEPPDGGLIYDLYVTPAYRRQGIARALYRHGAGWLAEQGAQWLTLSVYALNRPAYTAYEQWGFFPFFVAWERNL
ncbi:putative acetyltransferase [compost metagenome]